MSGQAFYTVFCGSPLIRGNKRNTDQWASAKHRMEGFSLHNSSLMSRKNQAKCENDCISRSEHRIKIAQPNLMILVSFSSAEDALSNGVTKYNTFSSQGSENPLFCFFGDTRYRSKCIVWGILVRCIEPGHYESKLLISKQPGDQHLYVLSEGLSNDDKVLCPLLLRKQVAQKQATRGLAALSRFWGTKQWG